MAYYSVTPKQMVRNSFVLGGATTSFLAVTSGNTYAVPVRKDEKLYFLIEETLPDKAGTTSKKVLLDIKTTGVGEAKPFPSAKDLKLVIETGKTLARNKVYFSCFGPFESGSHAVQGSTYTSTIGSTKSGTLKAENRIEFTIVNVTSTGTYGKASTLSTQLHTLKILAFVMPEI